MLIFSHIEKCAGTTLISHFRKQLPFQSVDAISNQNRITKNDLKKIKFLYPAVKVCSGHSITPDRKEIFEQEFGETQSMSIVREPLERLISNYVHDVRRGIWQGSLDDYAMIPWKNNYLLKFLGSGSVDRGLSGSETVDYLLPVRKFEDCLPTILKNCDIDIPSVLTKQNVSSQHPTRIPDDVKVTNGVSIGGYSITEKAFKKIRTMNAADINFWNDFDANFDSTPYNVEGPSNNKNNGGELSSKAANLYRNLIYKPLVMKRFGYHAIPRNSRSPELVRIDESFN